MLDDVLRWLVRVTGLEPRLLTLTAILMVYAASVYLFAKEKTGAGDAGVAPRPVGELVSAVDRVERGLETIAKYLINLEKQPSEKLRFQPRHEYEAFIPPPPHVAGAPPRRHHQPDPPAAPPKYSSPPKYPQSIGTPQERGGELPAPQLPVGTPQERGGELPKYPQLPVAPILSQLEEPEEDFFLPLPVISPQPQPEPVPPPQSETPPSGDPSLVVMETLRRMSRKAGRTP